MANRKNKWMLFALVPVTLLTGITQFESSGKTKLKPYKDIVGITTVCDGYTGKDIVVGKLYTQKECNALTIKDISEHGRGVLECINVQISHKEYEAYTSFAYNVGVGSFCSSNILKTLNRGEHALACKGLYQHPNGKPAWSNAGGKYVQGLQNRRYKEYQTCMIGVNEPKDNLIDFAQKGTP